MKKFISMVMAAAMVVSLVPATAFAAGDVTATAKVMDAIEMTADRAKAANGKIAEAAFDKEVPEVELTITGADYRETLEKYSKFDVTFTLDNATLDKTGNDLLEDVRVTRDGDKISNLDTVPGTEATYKAEKETVDAANKDALAAAIFKGEATYYTTEAMDVVADATTMGVPFKVGDVKTPGTTEADAVEALVGAANVDKVAKGEIAGLACYVATAPFDTYVAGDVVVFVKDLVTTEDVLYTEENVIYSLAYRLNAAGEVYKKVVDKAATPATNDTVIAITVKDWDEDYVTYTFEGKFEKDDVITFDLYSTMKYYTEGKVATVEVDSDIVDMEATAYASVVGKVLKASVKALATVAEEEKAGLHKKGLKIKAAVGNLPAELTLKVSKGFEFDSFDAECTRVDDDKLTVATRGASEITLDELVLEATTAKAGDIATIKVTAKEWAAASVEVMKVVDYTVVMSVDPEEDMPVIYSGTNDADAGLTSEGDHLSLDVTVEETFPGAWSMRKGFTFELPEGVYVTEVDVLKAENFFVDIEDDLADPVSLEEMEDAFEAAYIKGDHVSFEFAKRVFNDVDTKLNDDVAKMVFNLKLVAVPGFEGDVTLKLSGDLLDTQEVVIAKFVAPYTVKATNNDVIIDYRFTDIETPIVITEAEAGLWAKTTAFDFTVERGDMIQFEDTADYAVNEESEMEIDGKNGTEDASGTMIITVEEESDEEAAEVTVSGIQLFMQRNIPAGPYALKLANTMTKAFDDQVLLGQGMADGKCKDAKCVNTTDVADYSDVVKEAWVNVVTAGRDVDDASFTTKVLVPIGENYLVAGEKQYTLDVPAYINADDYTMLPVRAVAVALGIDNDAVQWDAATKTVIVMYGQRFITMTAGQKVVYVSGTALPAKSAVEIVDGRAFLGLRDLATALGVTKIDYVDGVASLN